MSSLRQTTKSKLRFCVRCSFPLTWCCNRRKVITFITELLKKHVQHTGYVYNSTFKTVTFWPLVYSTADGHLHAYVPGHMVYYSRLTLRLLMSYIYIYIYIYDIRSLRVNDLTLILLTWRKW